MIRTLWFCLLLIWLPALASDDVAVGIPGMEPGTPPAADVVDAEAVEIGSRLRCPVCQGLSVADSTSAAAVTMQNRVRELVAQGYSREQIEDYFVSKYGEWVLLDPQRGGLNDLIRFGPLVLLAMGLLAATLVARRSDDATRPAAASSAAPTIPDDPYAADLLAEVDHD